MDLQLTGRRALVTGSSTGVNNGGAYANRGWDDAAPDDWLDLYQVNVVAFLASARTGYINGANFRIDGGSTGAIN